jgi:hypothetical protein
MYCIGIYFVHGNVFAITFSDFIRRITNFKIPSLMMEAVRTSETSVNNYFTRQYIPEDNSELHTSRREDLKSHKITDV